MLSPRLMLILTFSMEDMDILDMPDTMDTLMPTTDITMASVLLMLSPRLMLTPTFSMEDMDMDTLDMLGTMDTPMVDMLTGVKQCSVDRSWTKEPPMYSSSVTTFSVLGQNLIFSLQETK